ncbi:hypothetical protein RIF29_29401 [Crotalaria pallida]|uniref:Agenet domain-containing protein n=1 Tax=Crotalaria pallida TaxID=3830 RepID=A0AAN9HXF9_CROPI
MRPPLKRIDFSRGNEVENLLEDDESKTLTETVYLKELRPVPPRIRTTQFSLHQKVDAFDNDGWWVGEITGRNGNGYHVYFASSNNEENVYPRDKIRVHHEWVNGEWVL